MRKRRKDGLTEVVDHDLRALLFWAHIGMRKSRGGQYEDALDHILETYAETVGFKFDSKPEFGKDL